MLSFCEPMLAGLVRELPEGLEWQYEVKWDGYRVQLVEMGDYCWVRPEVATTIKFAEWTEGGMLRHAEFEAIVQ